jgi:hypothetical protein
VGGPWVFFLSPKPSLSLFNDKKKEERRRRMGEIGIKEEMGEKKKWKEEEEKRKKSSVLGCWIILWVFFPLYEVATCDWGTKKPPFTHRPKGSYFLLRIVTNVFNSVS